MTKKAPASGGSRPRSMARPGRSARQSSMATRLPSAPVSGSWLPRAGVPAGRSRKSARPLSSARRASAAASSAWAKTRTLSGRVATGRGALASSAESGTMASTATICGTPSIVTRAFTVSG